MGTYEHYFRHYFLALQTLDEESLEKFYKQNFKEFLLRESDLTLNGVKVDELKRREIVGAYAASQLNSDGVIYLGDSNDLLKTTGIDITEETYIERLVSLLPFETSVFKNTKLIEKIKAYRLFVKEKLESIQNPINLEHRLEALIYKYKAEAKYIPNEFHPSEIEKEFGPKRKQAIYTIWNKKGKSYKAPTREEFEKIIPHLAGYPNAQKAAINDLDNMN